MAEGVIPSPETVSALMILSTILHGFALILTSFRLWFRYRIRRLWWDDLWAALALAGDAVCMVAAWTLTAPLDSPHIKTESLATPAESRRVHIVSYWLSVLFFTCSLWLARISIVFSVVRIVPPSRSVRMIVYGAATVFVCMWVFVLAAKSVACALNESWYEAPFIQCPMPNWVAVSEVCTDTVSDVILVALPLRLLWRVKLPSNQRIMVFSVFSTSILVSVVSVVHTSYLIPSATFIAGATAEIEAAVSLIVCNLLVLVTFIYRVTRNGRDLTEGLSDENAHSSNKLTTVDLEFSGGTLTTVGTCTTQTGGTGTGTGTGTGYTSMGTGTEVSSLKFASLSDGETTVGSVVVAPPPVHISAREKRTHLYEDDG